MDYLDRYIWEAQAHANELLELYSLDDREQLLRQLQGDWPSLLPSLLTPPKEAFVFLGEGPTQQERRLAKLSERDQLLLWVQARFLALRSASALQTAKHVLPGSNWTYRRAVRHFAEVVSQAPALPSPQDVALLRLHA